MSLLARYKKPGGFVQLVQLIETRPAAKKEGFLTLLEEESPPWAQAVREKALTLERILTWEEPVLGEISSRFPPMLLGVLLKTLPEEHRNALLSTFTPSHRRSIEDLSNDSNPSPGELSAVQVKFIEHVRQMSLSGDLRLEKIEPRLGITDNIEESLERAAVAAPPASPSASPNVIPFPDHGEPVEVPTDLQKLKENLLRLNNENRALKKENLALKDRLGQIKKLAG